MAYLITVQILIDADSESKASNIAQAVFKNVGSSEKTDAEILDWTIVRFDKVCDEVDDSIANETYELCDVFADYLVFARSELKDNAQGFWSEKNGWTTEDLATRYSATHRDLPNSAGNDAVLIRLPN